MAERFEIQEWGEYTRRATDIGWGIYDTVNHVWSIIDLTESQAETVKQALDEATKEK